jgi:hypothetical protein
VKLSVSRICEIAHGAQKIEILMRGFVYKHLSEGHGVGMIRQEAYAIMSLRATAREDEMLGSQDQYAAKYSRYPCVI